MVKQWLQKNLKGDPVLWGIVLMFSLLSVAVVYSATGTLAYKSHEGNTEYFLLKHSALIFLGLAFMWAAHKINYRYYSRLSLVALVLSVPLLLFAFFWGSNINDASRWITIPVINQTFQPSDLAKLALISYLASMLAKVQLQVKDWRKTLVPMMIWTVAICALIALTNTSTAVLLFATCMLLMFIGRVPFKYLATVFVIVIIVGGGALAVGQRLGTAVSRVEAFLDKSETPFQLEQSYIAIATGGVVGKGPGNSDQRDILPHPYSDFIFAIILEEYGLIGGAAVLFLYLALLYRGMVTVVNSTGAFGGLLSAGLSFSLVIQGMINMGVAVGLGPITGLPLPLLSMGGTSLIFTGISLGIILSVSRTDSEFKSAAVGAAAGINAKVPVNA
ncbi:FtsW/RodA/SpoVE family cell cycle protein [Pontibacter sp. BT310]|jgi:cell division protein FtsW|uniref:Probable peptidoglycan glycosyltransferase FtsW n=1 Tax=Pontibacter populi TaxID=890055 RepID=A0ABS6XBJ8_9BACT|nr:MULTISPECIES: FtsW/RodA/SpoVE family cell cycle protein [Pontibacter]MBJ6118538.1 FtsW/RodA/SpoVE family cell cycle protein [Pontibacter sp. BT310]MBR0570967.1 FtsW/RodA/SpoVE family cell cycle protein [Microvirga sp. STS03]MBW3365392.1 FtsW/RodA/SpoVE family cell cycle protein [Pontibacter populi]